MNKIAFSKLSPPPGMGKDAKKIFARKLKEIQASEVSSVLIDNLDPKKLALYAETLAKFQELARSENHIIQEHRKLLAYSGTILKLAVKLGFTPVSRMRLVKQAAKKKS